MEMSEYWTLDACSRKLSVFDACYAVALRKRVRCSSETNDIPGNTFIRTITESFRAWFPGSSTEWPGAEPADVKIVDVHALAEKYPDAAGDLRAFQQS
jgi:hypothetical protein